MKNRQTKRLSFSKVKIATISEILALKVKGGTDPVSAPAPMTQEPNRQGVCFAEK